MLSHADLLVGLASWLLADVRGGGARGVTISLERDGSVAFSSDGRAIPAAGLSELRSGLEARHAPEGLRPWPVLLGACESWTLRSVEDAALVDASGHHERIDRWSESPAAGIERSTRLVAVPDARRLTGRIDEPETLHALRALAAGRPDARLILKLPPEHVGRRW